MMPLLCISQVLDYGKSICHEGFKHVRLLLNLFQDNSRVTTQVHGGVFICKAVSILFISFARRTAAHSSSRGIVTLFTSATLLLLFTSFTVVASSGD
ncbi:hypothetical protein TNIN_110271 [Trichonephila inaurata madagascariensis]|uniref:Uncharacterized protein n=1 Tax=Trichonephila inaurata madagascariensis TaxID=2747483 RepID=A0A8X6XQX4_9ARAC|nr:hypothetical protein TNIN_110271 [Trichonephila inaurata madagascariensis]